jgi:DNA helicase-2/ATP-dependent DNA helicase PcrA
VVSVARDGTTRDVLRAVKDDIGLGRAMDLLDSSGATASHLDDLEALEQVALLHPDPAGFEPWLRKVVRRETRPDGVTLSTVHRVKGREWDHVVVYGASAAMFPHRLADDVEEERRVFHVAITRARRQAVVLADAERPSPFLAELTGSAPKPIARPARDSVRRSAPAPAPAALGGADQALYDVLRAWRRERARNDGVPAYVVLQDSHLNAIARARPTSMVDLARCPGMGAKRLDLYGDEILAVVDTAT